MSGLLPQHSAKSKAKDSCFVFPSHFRHFPPSPTRSDPGCSMDTAIHPSSASGCVEIHGCKKIHPGQREPTGVVMVLETSKLTFCAGSCQPRTLPGRSLISRGHAHRLLKASECLLELKKTSPIGDVLPLAESRIRPLLGLPDPELKPGHHRVGRGWSTPSRPYVCFPCRRLPGARRLTAYCVTATSPVTGIPVTGLSSSKNFPVPSSCRKTSSNSAGP